MAERTKRRNKNTNKELKDNIILFIVPFGAFLLSLIIVSVLSVIFDLQKGANYPIIAVLFAACSFIGGFISGKNKRKNGIVTGILYNLPTIGLILFISLIMNKFSVDLNILISTVLSLLSSAVGGIVGVNSRKKIKRGVR